MSIFYQATVLDVVIRDRRFDGVLVDLNGEQKYVGSQVIVLASGGFEANKDWLVRAWGTLQKTF